MPAKTIQASARCQQKLYLARLRVLGSIQADIIDVRVCEVIPGGGDADVDLAGQVDQLRVALAMISNHVVNGCRGRGPSISARG